MAVESPEYTPYHVDTSVKIVQLPKRKDVIQGHDASTVAEAHAMRLRGIGQEFRDVHSPLIRDINDRPAKQIETTY